jgi:Zn-dependent oligopeptidase
MKEENQEKNIFEFNKLKISDLKKVEKEYLAFKIKQYKKIKSIKSENKNFENTILDLCDGDKEYSDKLSAISLLMNVHTDKKFRDEAIKTVTSISQKSVDIEYDKDLYLSVLDYYKNNFELEKASDILEDCDKKLVEDIVTGYKRMGFDLSTKTQEKLKEKLKILSELQNNFDQNLNNYQDFILVAEEDLLNMPAGFKETLEKVQSPPQPSPKGEGEILYKIDLSYPKVGPFLKYSENRKLRKELSDKNAMKGGKKNLVLLQKIVKLRLQISKILGYKNFVDFKVEDRMAKNNENIQKFLSQAKKEIIPAGKKDIKELKDFYKNNFDKKDNLLNFKKGDKLEYFDLSFVSNKLYEEKYKIDEKVVKEYFEMENTLSFMFDYFGELFGFTAIEEKELSKEM